MGISSATASRARVFDFNSALVRLPARSVVDGLRANNGPSPTYDGVLAEHAAYVAALRTAGLEVTVLEALEQFPDSLFVEDPALVSGDAAILLDPGAPSRQGEVAALAPALATHFTRVLALPRGHVDGGDVLVTPRQVLIGLSARTDETGAVELRRLLASLGLASDIVRTPPGVLHLKSDCALLDEHTLLVTEGIARSGMFGDWRQLVVPADEPTGANVLRLNDIVLARAECPRTAALLGAHGLDVVALPTAQIARIDAGLSCMSLRWFDPRR